MTESTARSIINIACAISVCSCAYVVSKAVKAYIEDIRQKEYADGYDDGFKDGKAQQFLDDFKDKLEKDFSPDDTSTTPVDSDNGEPGRSKFTAEGISFAAPAKGTVEDLHIKEHIPDDKHAEDDEGNK